MVYVRLKGIKLTSYNLLAILFILTILFVFNVLLLSNIKKVKDENRTLINKTTLSLSEQLTLSEHNLEGDDIRHDIEQLQRLYVQEGHVLDGDNNYILLYIIKGSGCDRCINIEMNIFNERRSHLEKMGVKIVFLFEDYDQNQYISFINLFNIQRYSIKDDSMIIKNRFAKINPSLPILLLLNHNKRIIIANISLFIDKNKSERYYDKVISLVQ